MRAAFDQLARLDAEQRSARLTEIRAREPELAAELEALLRHHDGSSPVDRPLAALGALLPLPATLPSIDGLDLLERLGSGASGTVYSAVRRADGARLAVKVLHATGANESALMRFEREIASLRRFSHPFLATVHATGLLHDAGGAHPYLVMDLVEGRLLDVWLRHDSPSVAERVALLIRIAEGLHHAHLCGVLHRDLKPANILVDGAGNPRIIDFGVSRWFGAAAAADPGAAGAAAVRSLTASGEVVGTVAYMSPEQAGASPAGIDPRSDVYSLGLVSYEVLAGRRARDLSLLPLPEALQRIAREDVPDLPSVAGDQSQALAAIVRTAVARDPQERYGSAQDFAEDLRRFERGEPVAARMDHAVRRLRRALTRYRTAIALAGAAVLLLAVGLIAARAAQLRAERATAQARALAATLRDALLAVDPLAHGRAPTALDVIAAARKRMDEETLPGAVEDEVRSLLASAYARLGEHRAAHDEWRRVLDLRRDLLGATAEATLAAATALADQCIRTERVAEARELIEQTVLRGRTFDASSPLSLLDAEVVLAQADRIENKLGAAAARLERLAAVARLRVGSANPRTVVCLRDLCRLYLDQGRWNDAERLLDAIRAELAGDATNIGIVHDLESLAIEHLLRHGRGAEALPRAERLVAERKRLHGPDHRYALDAERYFGLVLPHTRIRGVSNISRKLAGRRSQSHAARPSGRSTACGAARGFAARLLRSPWFRPDAAASTTSRLPSIKPR